MNREWLETNGIGGFASSTECGMNTRRYHGLLVAAVHPPVGRMVLLSKLEETVVWGGGRVELGTNRYPGAVHPEGHRYLKEFRREPCATWVFHVDGLELTKSVWMVQGENTTVIEYQASHACTLELTPLIAFRDYHSSAHENTALNPSVEIRPGAARCSPTPAVPTCTLRTTAPPSGQLEIGIETSSTP